MAQPDATRVLARARRWIAVAAAASAVLYVVYGVVSGWSQTREALAGFAWTLAIPVLLTTLGNYGLRYAKWVVLLGRVDVHVPHRANLQIYAIGLLMTLSPAKVGEVVKPYLVSQVTGTTMLRTLPVLAAERATDAVAILLLAGIGVSTYASDQVVVVAMTLATVLAGLAVLMIAPVAHGLFNLAERVPGLQPIVSRAREAYSALHACLSPGSLLICLLLSLGAWWLECVGTWLVLRGLDLPASLGVSTFIYSFATGIGALSPGGVGVADAGLIEGMRRLIPGTTLGTATAAALIIRVATLWFGVVLGAIALTRTDALLATRHEHAPVLPDQAPR